MVTTEYKQNKTKRCLTKVHVLPYWKFLGCLTSQKSATVIMLYQLTLKEFSQGVKQKPETTRVFLNLWEKYAGR